MSSQGNRDQPIDAADAATGSDVALHSVRSQRWLRSAKRIDRAADFATTLRWWAMLVGGLIGFGGVLMFMILASPIEMHERGSWRIFVWGMTVVLILPGTFLSGMFEGIALDLRAHSLRTARVTVAVSALLALVLVAGVLLEGLHLLHSTQADVVDWLLLVGPMVIGLATALRACWMFGRACSAIVELAPTRVATPTGLMTVERQVQRKAQRELDRSARVIGHGKWIVLSLAIVFAGSLPILIIAGMMFRRMDEWFEAAGEQIQMGSRSTVEWLITRCAILLAVFAMLDAGLGLLAVYVRNPLVELLGLIPSAIATVTMLYVLFRLNRAAAAIRILFGDGVHAFPVVMPRPTAASANEADAQSPSIPPGPSYRLPPRPKR
ncbi:MAG: hypothetical protein QM770_22695 [Tepidisphaeraceae bacterium]